MTADQYAERLSSIASAGPPTALTDETDTNQLLGRPDGYTSASVIADSRISPQPDGLGVDNGAVVEVFDDADSAQRRSDYIQRVRRAAGPLVGSEYNYLDGPALLRVSGTLTRSQADEYQAAWTN